MTAFCWESVKFDAGAADVVGLLDADVFAGAGDADAAGVVGLLDAEVFAEACGLVEPVPFFDPLAAAAAMMTTTIASAQ